MRATIAVSAALCLVLALSAQAFGDETVQTDWAGGGGVLGPVPQWGNHFSTAQGIDWASPPGALALLSALPYPLSVTSSYGEPACLDAGDIDGDRDADVISNERDGDRVMWYENVAAGTAWLRHPVDQTSDGPNDVLAALPDPMRPRSVSRFHRSARSSCRSTTRVAGSSRRSRRARTRPASMRQRSRGSSVGSTSIRCARASSGARARWW
jgi:hypothetical protein